jgi:hypothetical protein
MTHLALILVYTCELLLKTCELSDDACQSYGQGASTHYYIRMQNKLR